MNKNNLFQLRGIKFLIMAAAIVLIIVVSAVKYNGKEVNYSNSDAVWHTLLTIECYNETPVKVHKFLPIVSLGGEDDKWISWGSTVSDDKGNYYYTSFSPAGYFLPYLFFRLFSLPVTESSLFLFNTILLCLSTLILMELIIYIYREYDQKYLLAMISAFIYVTFPEILHGMGITYWHQSIMQVTLILQIYAYKRRKDSDYFVCLFYILCLINPYIEWSGYVANVGFAIAEIATNVSKKAGIKNFIFIGLITLASFNLFCVHYLSTINPSDFFGALKERFLARNFSVPIPISLLIKGYLSSFGRLFFRVIVIITIIVTVSYRGIRWLSDSILIKNGDVVFVSLFPILENFLMKEHAVNYSYDRMKLSFLLCILFCDLVYLLIKNINKKVVLNVGMVILSIYIGVTNLVHYKQSKAYIWEVNYRSSNIKLRDYIDKNYDDAVYGFNASVRGYINLLYKRGIHEWQDAHGIAVHVNEKNRRYGVLLLDSDNPKSVWSMNEISSALIYDRYTDKYSYLYLNNGEVCVQDDFQNE